MKAKLLACILTAILGCVLTAVLGPIPYSFAVENNNPSIIFNQNNFDSDTSGNFPGSVSFVQNSIVPSQHGVANDVQPHPTSFRKTMVLFKPKEDINNQSQITVTAKKENNGIVYIVYQGLMTTPDKLTKLAGQTDFNGEISKPNEFDRTISDSQTLSNFENDPEGKYFQQLFNSYNSIHIRTSDGNWARNFHLPDGQQFNNKIVTFTSNAGYSSNIFYTNNSLTMNRGDEFTLKNVGGIWYANVDAEWNKIAYSDKIFSSILPANIIQPGLQLSFRSGTKEGTITDLNISAPNELIVHTIDLGMLTPPRDKFSFQKDPELHRQYFHQLPISRLTVSEYEPQHFTKVMLPDGRLLTDFDPSQGGVHDGTMRQQIAKVLVSHGINNANYGINSSGGIGENWHPFSSVQLTAHNAVGKYANGVQVHGLSGGNGMVTLQDSIGNEFSHEFGHNFGLGHYPGGFNGAINRPANQVNSTWGWDADRNFFIPNFERPVTNQEQCYESQCVPPFAGRRFGAGAMSGGAPLSLAQNGYTLHTPYELNSIQNFFESKAVFSPDSPTGFTKWDASSKQMVSWKNMVKNDLMAANSNQVEQKPYKQGIPVATIVGYYDPNQQLSSYLYPALHGSFGAVYEDNFSDSTCQLNVFTRNAGTKTFNLYARRLDGGYMNKIHVNIEEALKPYRANVSCNGNFLTSIELNEPQRELNTSVISAK
ncbi:M66 family metalloprotease [Spirulina sp. 06S082]|uniref:M66 family metalloprotease n=1 Tax=Spirulina sp. 06S082 TaxID=3110248 RepID=UPI002B20D8F5|nr:M66 family metalloprotease [Spirulina sp. 06S082]MEA5468896.1 M66 family metalloprotease [Spirulina sp. 06S082]